MMVDNPTEVRSNDQTARMWTVRLSAYVDLPLSAVLERFAGPEIDDLLTAAMRSALGARDDTTVRLHAGTPVWESDTNVRVPVTWGTGGPPNPVREGTATVSLLVVQSGRHAITELLVVLPVPDDHAVAAAAAAATTHRILDELTCRLEADAGLTS